MPTPNVGRWFVPGGVVNGTDAVSLADDMIYFRPFFVTREVRLDTMGLRVTTSAAGGTAARLGIYKALTNGLPGRLLVETANILWTTSGDKTAPVSMSESLFPGVLYYAAMILRLPDGTRNFQHDQTSELGSLNLGGATAAESIDGTLKEPSYIEHATVPSWTAMPDPADMTSPVFRVGPSSDGAPRIAGRIATGFGGEGPGHAGFNYPWNAANKRWRIASRLVTGNSPTAQAMTPGTVYYAAFFASTGASVAKVAIDIAVGDAGSEARIGLYSAHASTGLPSVLLAETAVIDTATSGVKEEAIGPIVLAAKTNYWLAVGNDGAPEIRRISWAQSGAITSALGWTTSASALGNQRPSRSSWALATFVAATGFDDPATAAFAYGVESSNMVFIAYELSP